MYRLESSTFLNLSSVALALLLSGCGGGGGSTSGGGNENNNNFHQNNKVVSISNNKKVYNLGKISSSSIELSIEGKKDIFVVATSNFYNQNISISSSYSNNIDTKSFREATQNEQNKSKVSKHFRFKEEILNLLEERENNSSKPQMRILSKAFRTIDSINLNKSSSFCIDMNSAKNCTQSIMATAKKVVKNIETPFGTKSLVIWLEDKNSGISQKDIDKLASIFLKSGGGNDIYDWVSTVFGAEWGANAKQVNSKLVDSSNIIDILLYDMSNSGLAGYFWAKDAFKKSSVGASNEKLMFYINTQLLRVNPKETYTTLAHEFQHMIHFYQRDVLKDIHDSSWLDELMSETTEDLVATKIGYMGPRNVNPYNGTAGRAGNRGGRFPNFNRYNTSSITTWNNTTRDYSKVSAFGTFLTRNYDGAHMLNKLMYSSQTDQGAILDATGEENFNTLINKWACAVVLSDKVGLNNKLEYNFGDFKYSSFNGITYELGSINFFNYVPQPQFKASANLEKSANLYYKVGSNLSGNIKIDLNIPKGADVSIVAK